MKYEDAIKELEEIIEKLNTGKLSMSDASKYFERGAELSKFCYEELKSVKGKVSVIKEELGALLEEEEWGFLNY